MTDKKISQLTNITGSNVDDTNDELAIVDASSNETKAITVAELSDTVLPQGLATMDNPTFAGFTITGDASFEATKQLAFEGRSDGSGFIDQLLKLSAGDIYGRPSVSYYDAADRHRVAAGFHERNGSSASPGLLHDAYEIKTSADPAGSTPSNMLTRFAVGTDADLATVTCNAIDFFDLGDGTATQVRFDISTGSVDLGDGTNENVVVSLAAERAAFGYDASGGNTVLQAGVGKGLSFCTNNATFGAGEVWSITSSGRLDASDSVTGAVAYFGTDNVARELGISGTRALFGYDGAAAYVEGGSGKGVKLIVNETTEAVSAASSGNVGIGESSPDYKLDVNGAFGFSPGASVTPVDNGDVVFELTNNTTLTIKAKGSDGVVRSGTVTLE